MVDNIKIQARERMAATGEAYATARRNVARTRVPGAPSTRDSAAGWTWAQAADRLDALAGLLEHAHELREHLTAVHAARPPRSLPGWPQLLTSLGVTRFGVPAGGLVAAAHALAAGTDLEDLDRACAWHQSWYLEQAYALLRAAAHEQTPPEVPAPVPEGPTQWPEQWWSPQGARDVAVRAGTPALTGPVLVALTAIDRAAMAAAELDDRRQEKIDRHLEDGCHDEGGYGGDSCLHSLEPAEYEIEAWTLCEEAAAGYESAVAGFCQAVRQVIRAHATTSETS